MEKVDRFDLYSSMQRYINEESKRIDDRLDKAKEKLKTEKHNLIDKLSINSAIKGYQEKKRKYSILDRALYNLRFDSSHNSSYSLPAHIKKELDDISSYLSDEDVKKLNSLVNDSSSQVSKESKGKITHHEKNVRSALKVLGLESKEFLVYGTNGKYKGEKTSFSSALDKIVYGLQNGLSSQMVYLKPDRNISPLNTLESRMFDGIKEIIDSGELKDKEIKRDFSEIKEVFEKRNMAQHLVSVIPGTIKDLRAENDVDFSKVISFLQQVYDTNKKVVSDSNKFLDKYDLEGANGLVKLKATQKAMEQMKNAGLAEYTSLACELERLKNEDPDNHEKIKEIQDKMYTCVGNYSLDRSDVVTANREGKEKYRNQKDEKEALKREISENLKQKEEFRKSVMESLREYAIRELEFSGAFNNENFEVRNGDVYSTDDREAMISRKMNELIKLVDMSPEQRGLAEGKRRGVFPATMTINDLTPQQLNDFRLAYRDSSYDFMEGYKRLRSEEKEREVKTVYGEYVKYKAGLPDKSTSIGFAEFAKKYHGLDNVNDFDMDEDEGMKL